MANPKILAFAGSLRTGSWNKKLVKIAAAAARKAGADVTEVDLRDFPMPIFDEDLEARDGMPEPAQRFKKLMLEHQGFLISSPEYNSSITAVMKNTIDWVAQRTRPLGQLAVRRQSRRAHERFSRQPRRPARARPSADDSRQYRYARDSGSVGDRKAHEAFDADGKLKDAKQLEKVEELASEVVRLVRKLTDRGGNL